MVFFFSSSFQDVVQSNKNEFICREQIRRCEGKNKPYGLSLCTHNRWKTGMAPTLWWPLRRKCTPTKKKKMEKRNSSKKEMLPLATHSFFFLLLLLWIVNDYSWPVSKKTFLHFTLRWCIFSNIDPQRGLFLFFLCCFLIVSLPEPPPTLTPIPPTKKKLSFPSKL